MSRRANKPPPDAPRPAEAALEVSAPPAWTPTPELVRALAGLLVSMSDRRERAAAEVPKEGE
jgi:hypothetical protein